MMAVALKQLNVSSAQLQRLLEQIDRLLEADRSPWTEEMKTEAARRAEEWLERIRQRRKKREAALAEKEKIQVTTPAGRGVAVDTFTDEERVELFADLSAEVDREMQNAVQLLQRGEISPNEFRSKMEYAIWVNARAAFIAGKVAMGGTAGVSKAEEREIGRWGNFQVNRLYRFTAEIKAGQQSAGQIAARAGMYANAVGATFEMGKARAWGDLRLPQVPRDGKTRCRTNCKCELEFEPELDDQGNLVAVNVYWRLRPAEHCDDCLVLAAEWNPRRVEV